MALARWTPCERCGQMVHAADLRPLTAAWVRAIDDTAVAWLGECVTVRLSQLRRCLAGPVEDQLWRREAAASTAAEAGGGWPDHAER